MNSLQRKTKLTISWLMLVIAMVCCACHSDRHNRDIFHYNEASGIATLDPVFAKNQSIMWAVHQLYNTLVEVDEQLQMKSSLAKSWDIAADHLTYTFHLRSDVYFHDNNAFAGGKGRRLVAGDVVYSFARITDKRTASSGAWIFNNRVDSVRPFVALDDSTFQLKLQRPFNAILGILSMQYCSIVPREVVEKYGKDFRSHPCGTGPFQFVTWEEGQALILKRNANYFEKDSSGGRLPYLEGVKVSFFDNKATEFLEFRQQRLDFVNDIDPSFKDEVLTKAGELRKEWSDRIVLAKQPFLNIEYLGILQNSDNPLVGSSPLQDKRVRQAICYAIDRKRMMLYLRNSLGTPAQSGFIPLGLPAFDSMAVRGYQYDPQKAAVLLKQAGYSDGAGLPVIILNTIPVYADLGSYIANELAQAGIKVQVEVMQKSLLLEKTAKGDALFFRGSWIADYPDAENYMSVFYSKNPAPPNYTRYHNERFDQLYERALEETIQAKRDSLYHLADQQVINDAPVVPLWYDMVIHLTQPYVTGLESNSLNMLELRKVRLSDGKGVGLR